MRRYVQGFVVALLALVAVPAGAQAAFPGANGKIVYTCARSADAVERLCTVGPDGTGRRRVKKQSAAAPAASPDGRHVAYDGVFLRPLVGGVGVKFRSDAYSASWAPSGTRLAYVTDPPRADDGDVLTAGFGGAPRNLTRGPAAEDGDPAWSPDGKRIAFYSDREDGRYEIYTVAVAGRRITRVTRTPESSTSPSWSPDGRRIAFVRERASTSDQDGGTAEDVFVINANGTGEHALTHHFDAGERGTVIRGVSWSPDGKRVVFGIEGEDTSGNELRTVGADGSGETSLGVTGFDPDWAPAPGTGPAPRSPRPRVRGLRIKPKAFWTLTPPLGFGRRSYKGFGTRIRFRMNTPGGAVFASQAVKRGRPRGGRQAFAQPKLHRGVNRFRWYGGFPEGFALERGTFRLVITPFSSVGDRGRAVSKRFRVRGICFEPRRRTCS